MVGKLSYLMMTRPAITFAVSVVGIFVNTEDYPLGGGNEDFELFEESSREGFLYSHHGHVRVANFSDVDWAWCPFDRRSTT